MPTKPSPTAVDVPFGTLNLIPPDHAGPVGRLTSLKDCEVQHYVTPQPGVGLPKMLLQPRGGFGSMTRVLRDARDGSVVSSPAWIRPELLHSTGQQLLAVTNDQPRVYNGSSWTDYGPGGVRTLTNKLSESVLHTSDSTITAPDSAKIGSVTCFVWTQLTVTGTTGADQGSTYIGFRNSSGAWLVQPRVLFSSTVGYAVSPIAKVVSDGTRFWVFHNSASNIEVKAYDTNGALLDSSFIARLISSAGHATYWDVTDYPAVTLAQGASTAGDSGVQFSTWTFGAGLPHTTNYDITLHCDGPVAWLKNPLLNSKAYLATYLGQTGAKGLYGYEVVSRVQVFEYTLQVLAVAPDSMTGWTDSDNAGVRVNISFTLLSNANPTYGPPHDPALRLTATSRCTRIGTLSIVSTRKSVLQVSRAFQMDDDWYALTYYQSGSGLVPFGSTVSINMAAGTNSFVGAPIQDLPRSPDDLYGGGNLAWDARSFRVGGWASQQIITQAQATITHNAGDSVTNNGDGTATWVLLNSGTFANGGSPWALVPPSQNSYLAVTGSAITGNNTSFLITEVLSAHSVKTRANGTNGISVTSEALTGVTASEVANVLYIAGDLNPPFPANLLHLFTNSGTITVAGLSAPNNGTFNVIELAINQPLQQGAAFTTNLGYMFLTSLTTQTFSDTYSGPSAGAALYAQSGAVNIWELFGAGTIHFTAGDSLVVTGNGTGADGEWVITSIALVDLTFLFPVTAQSGNPTVNVIPAQLLPGGTGIKLKLGTPTTAYTFTSAGATFDNSYLNAILVIGNAVNAVNNGSYRIVQVLSATSVLLSPLNGLVNQVSEDMSSSVTATVIFTLDTSVFQPQWMISSLSNPLQEITGAFENTLAYADWRYDGATVQNNYTLCLGSVPVDSDGSMSCVLPFRSQSWTTSDEIVNSVQTGDPILRSSVGLKQFTLSQGKGQAVKDLGELLLPGPMAVQFSASGFHDAGIVIGPERPFLVSRGTSGGLQLGGLYQYVIVYEISNEDGNQIQSIPSPALDVALGPTQNSIVISGRLPCPTNWPQSLVRVTLYRTAYQNGAPTTQHYRITNPLDPNGAGFTLSNALGVGVNDTWAFSDTVPDYQVLSSPTLYTDALQVPRSCAPPFIQGAVEWNERTWLTGTDGASWMSSVPTEGLQTWYSRLWRIPYPPEDRLVAQAPLEGILVQFCQSSIWYLPQTNNLPQAVPDPADLLPTPIPTPFTNGCTGWAVTLRAGVAYSSTAGGVWLLTRNLENLWLSQPIDGLLGTVTGMCLDGKQRLWVTDGTYIFVYDQLAQAWSQFRPPSAVSLVASYLDQVVYDDTAGVNLYSPTAVNDSLAGVITGIVPDFTVAGINLAQVRRYMRCWAIQLIGQYLGPHRLNVVLSYPDETDFAATTFDPYTPVAGKPYLMEFNPLNEEASTFTVRIYVDFTGVTTPGLTAKFEMLSMEVGVLDGQTRPVKASQIATGR